MSVRHRPGEVGRLVDVGVSLWRVSGPLMAFPLPRPQSTCCSSSGRHRQSADRRSRRGTVDRAAGRCLCCSRLPTSRNRNRRKSNPSPARARVHRARPEAMFASNGDKMPAEGRRRWPVAFVRVLDECFIPGGAAAVDRRALFAGAAPDEAMSGMTGARSAASCCWACSTLSALSTAGPPPSPSPAVHSTRAVEDAGYRRSIAATWQHLRGG